MGHYRSRRDDEAAAAGCAIGLLLLGFVVIGKVFYEAFRYRPPPYRPIAPNSTREQVELQKIQRTIAALIGAALIFGAVVISQFGKYNSSEITGVYFIVSIIAGMGAYGTYVHYRSVQRDLSQLDTSSLFPKNPRTYTIYPPKQEVNLVSGTNLMRSLLGAQSHLTFQIVADGNAIVWKVTDPQGSLPSQRVIDAVRSHYAEAIVVEETQLTDTLTVNSHQQIFRQHLFFRLANEYPAPIATLAVLKVDDPLTAITQRMDFLKPALKERLIFTVLVVMPSDVAKQRALERLKEGNIVPLSSVPTDKEGDNLHGLDDKLLNAKLAEVLFHAFLVVTVESSDSDRLNDLTAITPDVVRFGIPRHNHLVLAAQSPVFVGEDDFDAMESLIHSLYYDVASENARWRQVLLVLNASELSALWHLPDSRFSAQRIAWAGVPIPDALTEEGDDRVCVGVSVTAGHAQKVYLSLADRSYHHAIIGKTGTGKSTLLHNLIHQDIAAGRGVAVIDPHGKLIDDILKSSIPPHRTNDVVLLHLGDPTHPVPLNPFRIPTGVSAETAFNLLYWVMRKLYESVWRDRMDYVFRNVVQTLLTDPEATPRDVSRILLNDDYRRRIVGQLDESAYALSEFWAWYTAQPKSEQMEIASPILTRTSTFLSNRAVELMTCHPYSLHLASFLREQKILLLNLSGEGIHSEVGTLGAILLSHLFIAGQSLGYMPDGTLPRLYLYVDEVERMVTTPIPEMASTSRKIGFSLTLANQYMKQLSQDTLEGIIGNVGTHFVFEVGESDSRHLGRLFEPEIERHELLKLGAYHMAVKTRSDGKNMPPFVVKTLPPPKRVGDGGAFPNGQQAYTSLTATEISAWLANRYRVEQPKKATQGISTDGLTDYDA